MGIDASFDGKFPRVDVLLALGLDEVLAGVGLDAQAEALSSGVLHPARPTQHDHPLRLLQALHSQSVHSYNRQTIHSRVSSFIVESDHFESVMLLMIFMVFMLLMLLIILRLLRVINVGEQIAKDKDVKRRDKEEQEVK